jgi:hypothetical protein
MHQKWELMINLSHRVLTEAQRRTYYTPKRKKKKKKEKKNCWHFQILPQDPLPI